MGISVRDLVLILGGVFLVFKGVMEIRDLIVGEPESEDVHTKPAGSFVAVIAQIAVIDIVFSLDSVIAAVGMAEQYVPVMVAAILLAVGVMLLASQPLGHFIDNNPTIKMLALAFIVLIGVVPDARRPRHPRAQGLHLRRRWASRRWSKCLNLWAKTRATAAAVGGLTPALHARPRRCCNAGLPTPECCHASRHRSVRLMLLVSSPPCSVGCGYNQIQQKDEAVKAALVAR